MHLADPQIDTVDGVIGVSQGLVGCCVRGVEGWLRYADSGGCTFDRYGCVLVGGCYQVVYSSHAAIFGFDCLKKRFDWL